MPGRRQVIENQMPDAAGKQSRDRLSSSKTGLYKNEAATRIRAAAWENPCRYLRLSAIIRKYSSCATEPTAAAT